MTLEFVLKRAYGRKSQKNFKKCKTEQLSALLSPNRLSNFDQIIQVKGFNLNIPKLFKKRFWQLESKTMKKSDMFGPVFSWFSASFLRKLCQKSNFHFSNTSEN